ncbi:MAG: SurA N-terminal domain-containing protein, partial [Rhodothermales bacterium]
MTTRFSVRRAASGWMTACLSALFLVVTLAACGSGDDASAESDDPQYAMGDPISDTTLAAIVTSEFGIDTLTTEEFRGQFTRVASQVPQVNSDPTQARELRKNIVEDFVLRHALFGEADRLGVGADTAAVSQRLQQIQGQFPSEQAFQQALQADGLTEQDLRENIQEMIKQEEMFTRYSENIEQPTEEEITEYQEDQ